MERLHLGLIEGICRSNCVWCIKPYLRDKLALPYKDLKAFLQNNPNTFQDALIHDMGETLEHPDFIEIVQLLQSHAIQLPQLLTSLNTVRPFTEDLAKAALQFRTITIEIGGLTAQSRMSNMHVPLADFDRNFRSLMNLKNKIGSSTRITLKLIHNKNNYKDSKDLITTYQAEYPDLQFFESNIYSYPKTFLQSFLPYRDAEVLEKELLSNNFDEAFPKVPEVLSLAPFEENKHPTGLYSWMIGPDGYIYLCAGLALTHRDEFKIAHISTAKVSELAELESCKRIYKKMQDYTILPFCSPYCHIT